LNKKRFREELKKAETFCKKKMKRKKTGKVNKKRNKTKI
jgi:hypothetical protein